MLLPSASLRFTHHVKLISSFWKTRSRNARSRAAVHLLLDLVDADRRPRVHRRIDVAERPLVGGNLPVRDACTTRASAAGAGPSRSRDRSSRARRSGTPCPTRRTTGTPTCPASTARRRRRGATSRGCGRCLRSSGGGGPAGIALEPAVHHDSGSTACSTACRRTPAAGRCACRRAARTA